MAVWYVYNASGRILRAGVGPTGIGQMQATGTGEFGADIASGAVPNINTDTVNPATGALIRNPSTPVSVTVNRTSIPADGTTQGRLSGIPAGTVAVWFDDVTQEISDGELIVTTNFTGTFGVTLYRPGFRPTAFTFRGT